ncbi:MAG TPA: ABC transporter permease [Candidatus Sulfotelmatobacter sp.]|jgi:ABC-2 type transport system permease protein|nr:ABC transporter permease [Candidatus Sulfotelmatobacter sp.]
MSLRPLFALIRKESLQILRDPSSLLIAVVLPLILLFLFGYGVSFDLKDSPVCVVVEQTSQPAESLAASFQASPFFKTQRERAVAPCKDRLVSGGINGIVVIPADFAARLNGGDAAPIQILVDGSDPNTAGLMENYLSGTIRVWQAISADMNGGAVRERIGVTSRVWYNPAKQSRLFLLPGLVAVIMTLIGTMLTSLVVAREWERGTMEAMMATPLSVPQLLLGKLIPYYLLGMAAMAATTVIAMLLFGVPLRGSVWALAGVTSVFLLTTLGQGLLISTLAKNQFVATQAALFSAFLPAFLLSGLVYEIASMPWPIQWFTRIIPARYYVPSLQTLFLAGDEPGVLIPHTLSMLAIAAVMFAVVVKKTPRRLDG